MPSQKIEHITNFLQNILVKKVRRSDDITVRCWYFLSCVQNFGASELLYFQDQILPPFVESAKNAPCTHHQFHGFIGRKTMYQEGIIHTYYLLHIKYYKVARNRVVVSGLGIRSFALRSFAQNRSLQKSNSSNVSDSIVICSFALKNEWFNWKNSYFSSFFWQFFTAFPFLCPRPNCSPCSVALFKEQQWANRSRCSLQKSNCKGFTVFHERIPILLFCSQKTSNLLKKPNREFPTLSRLPEKLIAFSLAELLSPDPGSPLFTAGSPILWCRLLQNSVKDLIILCEIRVLMVDIVEALGAQTKQ